MPLFRVQLLDAPVVAMSLDTAGHDPEHGNLQGVAAVKFHAGQVIDTFEASAGALLPAFPAFVGDAPLVGFGLGPAAGFLGAVGIGLGENPWDLQELAALVVPRGADASLDALARELGVASNLDETTLGAAHVTLAVYEALVRRMRAQPVALLRRQADLLGRAQSPLAELISAIADAPTTATGGPMSGVDQRDIQRRLERPRPIGSPKPPQPLDPDELTRLLATDGPFAAAFPRYEPRLEQIAMTHAVARAFGDRSEQGAPHHLVVEGGTGIGKSVAYLLPAVLFALRNNVRVVISTNTINLQEQLIGKDIPDLINVLSSVPDLDLSEFRYTQMKGKANYLCLRRWEAMANSDLVGTEDARMLARTIGWLQETRTGDRAELGLHGHDLSTWDRMSATGFGTCTGAREGACFYRHARDQAAAAHLVVVNHALLLSNMQVDGSILPDFDYLIIDEAHNLEQEATHQFGFRVSQTTVEELVERLGNIVHSLGNVVRISPLEESPREDVQRRMEEAQLPLYEVRDAWAQLVARLTSFADESRGQGVGDDGELRITSGLRAQPAWSEIEIAWDAFERIAERSAERGEGLYRAMEELSADVVPGLEDLKGALAEWVGDQTEARGRVAGFVSDPDTQTVYWLGRAAGPLTMNGAPLEVGSRLHDDLFGEKASVVLTSATLAVSGEFAHVRERLGIEDTQELCLGSPFDYKKAALLALPTDVPEPSAAGYGDAVAQIVARLALEAGGRTLALFTSHSGIRNTAAALRKVLPAKGIEVLAQGVDGTPQQMLASFQENPKAVLLGTSSFWEGVDIANNAMKVLVVARLPFNVPSEPVFAARSDLYEQPFMRFAVPQAVLRFRQGFGRLIRNKNDHGVVVVLDSRITSKPYGRSFLASVPPATTLRAPWAEVMDGIHDWLAAPVGG